MQVKFETKPKFQLLFVQFPFARSHAGRTIHWAFLLDGTLCLWYHVCGDTCLNTHTTINMHMHKQQWRGAFIIRSSVAIWKLLLSDMHTNKQPTRRSWNNVMCVHIPHKLLINSSSSGYIVLSVFYTYIYICITDKLCVVNVVVWVSVCERGRNLILWIEGAVFSVVCCVYVEIWRVLIINNATFLRRNNSILFLSRSQDLTAHQFLK